MAFWEIALTISFACLAGMFAIKLKQPSIIGYIATGFILAVWGIMSPAFISSLSAFANVGIALLLFLVGIEMDLGKLKHLGKHILAIGILQSVLSVLAGFALSKLLGFDTIVSAYFALALSFSSTIIVIKFLSEKKDLSSLYGRIVVGVMLVEDFVAILMLLFLDTFTSSMGGNIWTNIGITVLKGTILVLATMLASKYMPRFLSRISTNPEALFLFSLAWGVGVAALVDKMGLGLAAGGFVAGIAFAKSAEHYEIANKVRWLRDFFIVLFFVALGSQMMISEGIGGIIWQSIVISLFVIVVNPLITIIAMNLLGYSGKTAFLVGLTTAQISEFSLVIATRGGELGYLSPQEVAIITLVGIITIILSSYLVSRSDALYAVLEKPLKYLEFRKKRPKEKEIYAEEGDHVILIGAHRMGEGILRALKEKEKRFVVIDFDPYVTKSLAKKGFSSYCGDGTDPEILEAANIRRAKAVISTTPSFEDNMVIMRETRRENKYAIVILTADTEFEGKELYRHGADFVMMPHFIGGEQLGEVLTSRSWEDRIKKMRHHDVMTLMENE